MTAPIDELAVAHTARGRTGPMRTAPSYPAISLGCLLIRLWAGAMGLVGLVFMILAVVASINAYTVPLPADDTGSVHVAGWIVGAVLGLIGLACWGGAIRLLMLASLASAVQDMARNSFMR